MNLHFLKFMLIEFFGSPIYSGIRVQKRSGKPFKSGHRVNTVAGLACNPHTNELAYTFVEDNSIVNCKSCVEIEND